MKKNIRVVYDSAKALVKQAESAVSQNKQIDPSIINTLTSIFNDIIEFEKVYLIQCQDRFFGAVLMDMDVQIDFSQRGPVDLKMKKTPIEISINPMFCSEYSFSQFTGLIINEITKLVWLHPSSFGEINSQNDNGIHKLLEKASDAASTSIVQRDIRLTIDNEGSNSNGCRLPPDAYTVEQLNDESKITAARDQNLEYYFKILERFKKDKNSGQNQPMPQMQMPMSGNGGGNQVATKNNSDGNQVHQWENLDSEEVKDQVTSMVSNVYNSLSEEQRGYIPAGVLSQIQKLLAPPEINWKQVLRKMVGSVPVPHRNTRRKLNRRQPERFDLPGQLPKRVVNVVCAFDTSGSMSDDDLRYCMNEVFNIVKVYEGFKITVIETDAEVQRVYEAKKINDLQLKMKGRGGTWFSPTIKYLNGEDEFRNNPKFPNAGKYKDALFIYFTDGYGESEIPKPKTYRNLWVVLDNEKNLSVKNPYGEVKSLKGDRDYRKMKGI